MSAMHIAVCVTGQKTCESLILEGAKLCGEGDELSVLHVARKGAQLLGDQSEADALEYLFRISHEYGASMMMLRADNIVEAIIGFVQKAHVDTLLMGRAGKPHERDLAAELQLRLPDIKVQTVWA
ncbi:MAG: universal stress protein UspA [Candidatus Fimadaptatus sp.]